MKKIIVLLILFLMLAGCGPFAGLRGEPGPILYENATISIVTDKALLVPKISDKEFMPIIGSRLYEFTKNEIQQQGNLEVASVCEPRTLKIVQEVTGITVTAASDIKTGFILSQLLRPSMNETKSDEFHINTTTTIIDCQSGKTLGTYNSQSDGKNPIDILQKIVSESVYYLYSYQRGAK